METGARELSSIDTIYILQEPRSVGWQTHNFRSEAGYCQLFSRNPGRLESISIAGVIPNDSSTNPVLDAPG